MANIGFSLKKAEDDDDINEFAKLLRGRKKIKMELGCSPLHAAVFKKSAAMVNVLLDQPDIEVNCRDDYGHTSLMMACSDIKPELSIIINLLNRGADANIGNIEKVVPLHVACDNNNLDLVKLLIQHGANINCQDYNAYTPLHYAIDINSRTIIEYLLENNADTSLTEERNLNPLMFALDCTSSDASNDKLILSYTQNLETRAIDGKTALMIAVNFCNLNMTRELIARGANVNAFIDEMSCLSLAVTCQDFDIFELLWRHVNSETVANEKDFMWMVCKYCRMPRDYKYFELILNTESVDLNVNGRTGFFELIFRYPEIDVEPDSRKCEYLNVIGWLFDRGLTLGTDDLDTLLTYFERCPYAMEVWELIFTRTVPDITQHIVKRAVEYNNLYVTFLLMSYCIHINLEDVTGYMEFPNEFDERFWRQWLSLFTPSTNCRGILTDRSHSSNDVPNRAIEILNETRHIKSLLELSRDAVRGILKNNYDTSEACMGALSQIEIPDHLRDIVRLKVPVNKYILDI